MTKQPKAANNEPNADMHREEEEEGEEEEETAAIPGTGGTRDGGGGGGAPDSDSGAGGSLASIFTNKKLIFGMAAVVAGYLAYRYYVQGNNSISRPSPSSDVDRSDETVSDEEEGQPSMPNIENDPQDPLKADDQAFDWVFGDEPQSDSTPPN